MQEGLQHINDFARDFHQVAGDLWQETFDVIAPPFRNELQHYPPEKRGSKYRRTGRLKRGWYVRFVRNGAAYQIIVGNPVDYTKWVVGSFDQRRNFQTDMHRETGWFLAKKTKDYWLDAAQQEFTQRWARYLSGFGVFKVTRKNR